MWSVFPPLRSHCRAAEHGFFGVRARKPSISGDRPLSQLHWHDHIRSSLLLRLSGGFRLCGFADGPL
jgi:hypothetical protein